LVIKPNSTNHNKQTDSNIQCNEQIYMYNQTDVEEIFKNAQNTQTDG